MSVDRILVVEDHDNYRRTLCELLRMKGRTVIGAHSGETALDLLKTEDIAILLTDINMPGMSGIELAKIVYATAPYIKIILSSAAGYMIAEELEFKFIFLPKPYNVDTLLLALHESASSTV
jgi:CheY-like chemotaxis protein